MEPAYPIALNNEELALLGELTVILGQADDIMVDVVAAILSVDRAAANAIMGSSKVGDNAAIWAHAIRNRTTDEDTLWLVEVAEKEIQAVSTGRNDFIHAVFSEQPSVMVPVGYGMIGSAFGLGGWGVPARSQRVAPNARRVRGQRERSVAELKAVRDQAARLACLIAHVGYLVSGGRTEPSPWLETLAPTLPPRLDTVAVRRAKVQPAPRPPSQKSLRARRREKRGKG